MLHTRPQPIARHRFVSGVCLLAMFSAAAVATGAAGGGDDSAIVIRGSKNLLPFVQMWVDTYLESAASESFDLIANGTAQGVSDLLDGRASIAMASRPMTEEERGAARAAGLTIRETVVARMGIAVIVNQTNTVRSLSIHELANIFSGESVDWSELGGPDQPINLVRKVSGWSPEFFSDRIMGSKAFTDDAIIVDSKDDVVAEVGNRPWAIGFTGMPEALPALDRVGLVKIVSDDSGVDATYGLSRPLFFYTTQSTRRVDRFIGFVVGSEAQKLITETGFYPAEQSDAVE